MSKMKIKILISAFLVIALAIAGYHCYCHYMVSEFYKRVDKGNTDEIIACVNKMPDVNMLDVCMPLYRIRGVFTQNAANRGYPIYYAVWKETDISVLEALLEKGADPNKKDIYDELPIQCLLSSEQKEMYEKVKLFVKYGADIHMDLVRIPGYWMQMSETAKEDRINMVIYLWESGTDERLAVGTRYEMTILHAAAMALDTEYLKDLYSNEKRPMYHLLNEKDANGETPLFYAVRYNKFENCEFLIHEGADVSIRNNEGKTAYDIAKELGYEECMEILN